MKINEFLVEGFYWVLSPPKIWRVGMVKGGSLSFLQGEEKPLEQCPRNWNVYGPMVNPFSMRFFDELVLSSVNQIERTPWKRFRKKLGITQVEMASRLGVRQSALSRYESRDKFPEEIEEKAILEYGIFKGGDHGSN